MTSSVGTIVGESCRAPTFEECILGSVSTTGDACRPRPRRGTRATDQRARREVAGCQACARGLLSLQRSPRTRHDHSRPHDRHRDPRARRARGAGAAGARHAGAEGRRGAGQGRGRRRQPAGRDAARGQVSAASRRAGHSGPGACRRSRGARRGREALEGRRQDHRARSRRRLCRIRGGARDQRAAGDPAALDGGSRRDPGDLLHGLAQRVRARRAEERARPC